MKRFAFFRIFYLFEVTFIALVAVFALLYLASLPGTATAQTSAVESSIPDEDAYSDLPTAPTAKSLEKGRVQPQPPPQYASVLFIENVGRFPSPAGVQSPRFQVHSSGGTVYLAPDALWITLLEPVEINPTP